MTIEITGSMAAMQIGIPSRRLRNLLKMPISLRRGIFMKGL